MGNGRPGLPHRPQQRKFFLTLGSKQLVFCSCFFFFLWLLFEPLASWLSITWVEVFFGVPKDSFKPRKFIFMTGGKRWTCQGRRGQYSIFNNDKADWPRVREVDRAVVQGRGFTNHEITNRCRSKKTLWLELRNQNFSTSFVTKYIDFLFTLRHK